MKKRVKEEMTNVEKAVLIAICIATVAFLLRMWDPAFFHWFHMKPMQEASFLRNIWQTIWLTFQIIVYSVWSISLLWMLAILISALLSLAIGAITGTIDILIAIWNLVSRIVPLPRVETSITRSIFDYIDIAMYEKFGEKPFDLFPTMFAVLVVSTIIALPLLLTLF